MKKIHILILLLLSNWACKKDPLIKDAKYVQGEILVGINANAELKDVLDVFNKLNFEIKEVMGFNYSVPIVADSLSGFVNFLNNKSYINCHGFRAYAFYLKNEALVKNCSIYFDLNQSNQNDLFNCIQTGAWRERHEDTKCFYLGIPVGSEHYWLDELKKYPFVKWTELNAYMDVHVD